MLTQLIGIRTTPAQVRLSNKPAKLNIKSPPPNLSIESTPAKVSVQSSKGKLSIDSTKGRQSMGYFTFSAMVEDMGAYAKRQFDRGVGDVVADGNRMADSRANVIAELAFESMFRDYNDRQFVLTFIPKVPPTVRYSPGSTQVNFSQNRPRVQIRANKPMINVEPGSVSIEVTPGSIRTFLRKPSTLDLTV